MKTRSLVAFSGELEHVQTAAEKELEKEVAEIETRMPGKRRELAEVLLPLPPPVILPGHPRSVGPATTAGQHPLPAGDDPIPAKVHRVVQSK